MTGPSVLSLVTRGNKMTNDNPLISCPGRCGRQIHPNAKECPACGFPSDMERIDGLLGSVSMICSILTGFGLAALVQLTSDEARHEITLQLTTGLWIVSSLMLFFVMVAVETVRRRELRGGRMQFSVDESDQFESQIGRLMAAFALALFLIAMGVICLGFYFSPWHGGIGILSVILIGGWIRKAL